MAWKKNYASTNDDSIIKKEKKIIMKIKNVTKKKFIFLCVEEKKNRKVLITFAKRYTFNSQINSFFKKKFKTTTNFPG